MKKFFSSEKTWDTIIYISFLLLSLAVGMLGYQYYKLPSNAQVMMPGSTHPIDDDVEGLEDSNFYSVSVYSFYAEKRFDVVKELWKKKTLNTPYRFYTYDSSTPTFIQQLERSVEIDEGTISKHNAIEEYIITHYEEDEWETVVSPFKFNEETGGGSNTLLTMLALIGIYENKKWLHTDKKVVITGDLDGNGSVLPVGSVDYKALTAEKEAADVFIVPKEQVAEVYKYVDKDTPLTIVGVESIEETIHWLENNL